MPTPLQMKDIASLKEQLVIANEAKANAYQQGGLDYNRRLQDLQEDNVKIGKLLYQERQNVEKVKVLLGFGTYAT